MQEPPARPGDVAPYVEDDRAATLGELRSTRRWLAVTAVWAVAATAIAVFALIEANKDDEGARTEAAGELGRVQRSLNDRIDELESRVDELPTSDDLSKLDGRIKDVEAAADKAATNTERLNGRVEDLEQRVDDLEQANESQTGTETTP
jgi:septal ring factor EnvC (AmiA/AmiB activator)